MGDQTHQLADLTAAISTMVGKMDEMHLIVVDLKGWKPEMESTVEELRQEVGELRVRITDISRPPPSLPSTAVKLTDLPPLIHPPPASTPFYAPDGTLIVPGPGSRAIWPRRAPTSSGVRSGWVPHPGRTSGQGYVRFSLLCGGRA